MGATTPSPSWARRLPAGGPPDLLVALAGIAVWLCIVTLTAPDPVALNDNDSWMHVVRLHEIIQRGSWDHGFTYRDGAPGGYPLHWTMPLDLLTLAMAAPLAGGAGWPAAIEAVAPYVGPATGVLLMLAVAWAAAPLGRATAFLTVLLTATSVAVLGYGRIGICDHHLLILALSVASVAGAWRLLGPSAGTAAGMRAGILGGLALWTALEAVPAVALAVGMVTVLATADPRRLRRAGTAFALSLFGTTLLALIIDRPSDLATTDRLGPVVLLLAGLGAAMVLFALNITRHRILAVSLFASAAGALWLGAYALCKHISPGLDDPAVAAWFWTGIHEFAPALSLGPSLAVLVLAHPLLAVMVATPYALVSRKGERLGWTLALVLACVLLTLSASCVRLSLHAEVPCAMIIAIGLHRLAGALSRRGFRLLWPVPATFVLLLPFVLPSLTGPTAPAQSGLCDTAEAAAVLDGTGDSVALADPSLTPRLLHQSRNVRTVTGLYHVNVAGLTAFHNFAAEDEPAARETARKAGVTHVLLCAGDGTTGTPLRRRLEAGQPPAWLEPVPMTAPESAATRLYRIVKG